MALKQQVQELSGKGSHFEQLLPQYRNQLQSEVDAVALSALSILHGPDTEAHFHGFTIDGVVQELQTKCPQVFSLFQELARTQRRITKDGNLVSLPELKAVMSMSMPDQIG